MNAAKPLVIFDDTNEKNDIIKDVIGGRSFGDIIVRRHTLESRFCQSLRTIIPEFMFIHVKSAFAFNDLTKELGLYDGGTRVIHFFSHFIISDTDKAELSIKKLPFIEKAYRVTARNSPALLMFPDLHSYSTFLQDLCTGGASLDAALKIEGNFGIEGLTDISNVYNFIRTLTGNFDSRYFNTLHGDEYTLIKSSEDKAKIKAEYSFYQLLPEDMRFWFVAPFNYREEANVASYTMERVHMADLAIKWVHGSVSIPEFERILDKYFYFFKSRHRKDISRSEHEACARTLYVSKVRARIESLKSLPEFARIAGMMRASCAYEDIDQVFGKYLELKEAVERRNRYPAVSVIGHGDPCFSNVLYSKPSQTLKFIDPKGAMSENDLWTDPYYDIAKLSHSVCGNYDFFNNGLFDISINEDFRAEVKIGFDNTTYKTLFRKKLEENGFDYLTVRIYEASLFISMLPLHIDYPLKVFGFILNAIHILEEIEGEL